MRPSETRSWAFTARRSPELFPPPLPLPDVPCALWLQEDPEALPSPLLPAGPELVARRRLDCGLSWATAWGSLEGYLCVWVEGSGLEKQTGPGLCVLEAGWGLEGSVQGG